MKFYDQVNGKLLAKGNFLTSQIRGFSIISEEEQETTYAISLCMDNLLPIPPVKDISILIELFVTITKDNNTDFFAVLQSESNYGELIDTVVKVRAREIISLLAYMLNENQKQNKILV